MSLVAGQGALFPELRPYAPGTLPPIGHGTLSRHASEIDIEPLDATFRDSSAAPLHSWFPYLEGYSPRFVRRVRSAYLPDARRVLEPFGGSGTTPIVLAQDGVACWYTEANPAMALIAATKLEAMAPSVDRARLAEGLRALSANLDARVATSAISDELQRNYASAFGRSLYFAEPAFESVLRLRVLNDSLAEIGDPLVARCFTVAVMASLIPTSFLKRAGDLRFRTQTELAKGLPEPVAEVRRVLDGMANDLAEVRPLRAEVSFLCDDARRIHESAPAEFDGVITSPPYLNGTNYIRNARLELWYLRKLSSKAHLRELRDRVVTSGINDVDANTVHDAVSAGVERVAARLRAESYDDRIAKMVGGYFVDMRAVLLAILETVRRDANVCIDIGDSIYGGIHVPTDDLLVEIGNELGYKLVEQVYLRKRRSKGGEELRQTLLVLKAPGAARGAGQNGPTPTAPISTQAPVQPAPTAPTEWGDKWRDFKEQLPHQQQPFAKRNWGSAVHSLCSYQGKLKPSLAYHLVEAFSEPGDIVVDPFSGAGTVPFEACRTGRVGWGIDISRLGYVLTRAKVHRPTADGVTRLLAALGEELTQRPTEAELESARAVSFNSAIPEYFHPDTLTEVLAARRFFLRRWDESDDWAFLFACCLHILHGNRPYALSRRSHPITPFAPTGDFEHRPLIPRLTDKAARAVPGWDDTFVTGNALMGDCSAPWGLPRPAGAVITSPPFFDSTRFYMTNWMRYWFTGWERADFDQGVNDFFETRQRRTMDAYTPFFAQAQAALRPGGHLVMHLGFSKKCDMAVELAARHGDGFKVVDTFYEGVEHCESHGVMDKGTVSGHSYLVLQRRD